MINEKQVNNENLEVAEAIDGEVSPTIDVCTDNTEKDQKKQKRRIRLAFGGGILSGVVATVLYVKKVRPVLRDANEARRRRRMDAKEAKKAQRLAEKHSYDSAEEYEG